MTCLTTCQQIFISIFSSQALFYPFSSQDFLSFLFFVLCFSSRHRGPRVEQVDRQGRRRTEGTLSRGNFAVWLLITASEDRVGNHLIYFVRYLPDPFPYNKYMACYCMKFIFKGYILILEQPFFCFS